MNVADVSKVVRSLTHSGDKRFRMSNKAFLEETMEEAMAQRAAAYVAWDLADALCKLETPNEKAGPPPQPEGKE